VNVTPQSCEFHAIAFDREVFQGVWRVALDDVRQQTDGEQCHAYRLEPGDVIIGSRKCQWSPRKPEKEKTTEPVSARSGSLDSPPGPVFLSGSRYATLHTMRKVSIVILVVVILAGVLFIVFHTRRQARQSIAGIGVLLGVRDHQLETETTSLKL